jgi:hypothetical protein
MPPDISQNIAVAARDIPAEVTNWLGRLVLLYGVPFHYLIPAGEMLPRESIRFFFLDPIWIQYLVQGACSVGNTAYGDTIVDRAMNTLVQPKPAENQQPGPANMAAAGVRDRLRQKYEGVALPEQGEDLAWPLTGFLLRSAVVDGWRGLEVMAYRNLTEPEQQKLTDKLSGKAKDIFEEAMKNEGPKDNLRAGLRKLLHSQAPAETEQLLKLAGVPTQEAFLKLMVELVTPLKPLRIEQLSQDVMLGIFNGLIGQLVIRQPQEGLHFGLTPENQSYTKKLRDLKTGRIRQDHTIILSQNNLMRDQENKGVINIAALAAKLKEGLANIDQLKEGKFTSAEFAVQMIEAPGEFTFQPHYSEKS